MIIIDPNDTSSTAAPKRDEQEIRAQAFVAEWEQHLLDLIALSVHEASKRLFASRNKLVADLRDLLREERIKGYDDARRALTDKINEVARNL